MKALVAAIAMIFASQALASGFVCKTQNHPTEIKIYNQTNPKLGTKNGAVMVFSDPTVKTPNKTIAVFKHAKRTLRGSSNYYLGKVDLRVSELRKGEYLLGTRLGYLAYVGVGLNFSELNPVKNGGLVRGVLFARKRNGDVIRDYVTCRRYLKN